MTTSEAQRRTNRQNAKKSTGPKSTAGKAVSSQNAVTHGGYAGRLFPVERGPFAEDPDEFSEFVNDIVDALDPRDPIEREEAVQIALAYIRRRRAARYEAAATSRSDEPAAGQYDSPNSAAAEAYERRLAETRGLEALSLLRHVMELTSRIDARATHDLNSAMQRYEWLRNRPRPDLEAVNEISPTRNEPNPTM